MRLLLTLLGVMVLGFALLNPTLGQEVSAQSSAVTLESPEPGVSLIGTPNQWAGLGVGYNAVVSPDGEMVVGSQGGKLVAIDRNSRRVIHEIDLEVPNIQMICYSPDGKQLALTAYQFSKLPENDSASDSPRSPSLSSALILVDDRFRIERTIELPSARESSVNYATDMPVDVSYSPDGRTIVVVGQRVTHAVDSFSGDIVGSREGLFDINEMFVDNDTIVFRNIKKSWDLRKDDLSTLTKIGKLDFPATAYYSLHHPKLPLLAYHDTQNQQLKVANYQRGKILLEVPAEKYILNSGCFSSDGKRLAGLFYTTDYQATAIRVLDIEKKQWIAEFAFDSQVHLRVSFADDDHLLIFDTQASRLMFVTVDDSLQEHLARTLNQPTQSHQLSVDQTGENAILNWGRQEIDLQTGKVSHPGNQFSRIAMFASAENDRIRSVDNRSIELVSDDKTSRSFALPRNGQIVKGLLSLLGSAPEVRKVEQSIPVTVALEPSGKTLSCLYVMSHDGIPRYIRWQVRNRKVEREVKFSDKPASGQMFPGVLAALHPDGRSVVQAKNDQIVLTDMDKNQDTASFEIPEGAGKLALNHDGSLVAIGFHPEAMERFRKIQVYDLDSGDLKKEFESKNAMFTFAPHAPRLAIADMDHSLPVQVFDTESWQPVVEHETDHADRFGMQLSGDGKTLVFSLVDSRLEIWNLNEIRSR